VAAKIRAQARNLSHEPLVRERLMSLSRRVRSGDPDNLEAQASQIYWPALFRDLGGVESPFRRIPGGGEGKGPNALLDYGYAVLRAGLGRAIVSAGLLPALGVAHHNRANPFCLADDLIEPLRPMVDGKVRMLVARSAVVLDQSTKGELVALQWQTVRMRNEAGPLSAGLSRYAASFVQALAGEGDLVIPEPVGVPENNGEGPRGEESPWS